MNTFKHLSENINVLRKVRSQQVILDQFPQRWLKCNVMKHVKDTKATVLEMQADLHTRMDGQNSILRSLTERLRTTTNYYSSE